MKVECQDRALREQIEDVLSADPVLFTSSGTTGTPKPCETDWTTLMAGTSAHGSPNDVMVLGYPVRTAAGLSVLAYARRHDCTLRAAPLDQLAPLIEGATHLCTTPTLMRRLLMSDAPIGQLRTIVLGGEAAPRSLLSDLGGYGTRVVQTYASSEHGLCLSWSDGEEGIPAHLLTTCWLTDDGELLVCNQPTGDFFRLENGRAYFIGRKHGLVNVAGQTVQLGEIERALCQVPGVTEARVLAKASTLTGHVLFAEVVGAWDKETMDRMLATLPRVARPYVKRVDRLPIAPSGKVAR